MKKETYPWRNNWKIKFLKMAYLPIMIIFNGIPTIYIMFQHDGNHQIFFSLMALIYFFSVLGGYLYLVKYFDKRLKKEWVEQQEEINNLPDE